MIHPVSAVQLEGIQETRVQFLNVKQNPFLTQTNYELE